MPAQQPVNGVARCVVRGTANGRSIVNVFHIQNGLSSGVPYTLGGIQTLGTNVGTFFKNRFLPQLNGLYGLDDVEATDLSTTSGVSALQPASGSGSVTGSLTPQSAACCVTWKIARRYRGGHPRTYLGPLGSSAFESTLSLSSAFVANVLTAATGFRTDINSLVIATIPQTLVAVHRTRDNVQLAPPLISLISGAEVDARIDSMRRRLGPDR